MQYYISPRSTVHASKGLDLGITGSDNSPYCRAMEILTYSNDQFAINGCRPFLLDTTPHLNVMKLPRSFSIDQT